MSETVPSTTTHVVRSIARLAVAALLLAVTVGIVGAGTAQAASPKMGSSGYTRDCISTSKAGCKTRYQIAKGTGVTMHCWQDGSTVTEAYKSQRWFYITASNGKKGWIHSSRVVNQVSTPICTKNRGISAARWASEKVGVTNMTAEEAKAIGYPNERYWSGFCAGFQNLAYRFGAKVTPRFAGHARDRYHAYKNAKKMRSMSSTPSVGSPVFYPNLAAPYGHVVVYVGNGYVASTHTKVKGKPQPNYRTKMTGGDFGTPAGWVAPNDV